MTFEISMDHSDEAPQNLGSQLFDMQIITSTKLLDGIMEFVQSLARKKENNLPGMLRINFSVVSTECDNPYIKML